MSLDLNSSASLFALESGLMDVAAELPVALSP
jgi:hypothetical protein